MWLRNQLNISPLHTVKFSLFLQWKALRKNRVQRSETFLNFLRLSLLLLSPAEDEGRLWKGNRERDPPSSSFLLLPLLSVSLSPSPGSFARPRAVCGQGGGRGGKGQNLLLSSSLFDKGTSPKVPNRPFSGKKSSGDSSLFLRGSKKGPVWVGRRGEKKGFPVLLVPIGARKEKLNFKGGREENERKHTSVSLSNFF